MNMTVSEINDYIRVWHILLAGIVIIVPCFVYRWWSYRDYKKRKRNKERITSVGRGNTINYKSNYKE